MQKTEWDWEPFEKPEETGRFNLFYSLFSVAISSEWLFKNCLYKLLAEIYFEFAYRVTQPKWMYGKAYIQEYLVRIQIDSSLNSQSIPIYDYATHSAVQFLCFFNLRLGGTLVNWSFCIFAVSHSVRICNFIHKQKNRQKNERVREFGLFCSIWRLQYCKKDKSSRCEHLFCQSVRVCVFAFNFTSHTCFSFFYFACFYVIQSCSFMTFHSMCWRLLLFSLFPVFATCHIHCKKIESRELQNNSNSISHPPFPKKGLWFNSISSCAQCHMWQPYPKQHIFSCKADS